MDSTGHQIFFTFRRIDSFYKIWYAKYKADLRECKIIFLEIPDLKTWPALGKILDWNSFRANLSYSGTCFRTIPNQFEKRFVSRLMKKGQKSIRLNLIHSEASIRMNPNQVFNPNQSEIGLIQTEFLIRIIPTSDSFVLNRIITDWKLGMDSIALMLRNESD